MLLNAGYMERSNPRALKRQWMRSGISPFPRFHVIRSGYQYHIHLDTKEEHGKTFGFGGIEDRGHLIVWELARIRSIHFQKAFQKLDDDPGHQKKKKLLSHDTNFYKLLNKN